MFETRGKIKEQMTLEQCLKERPCYEVLVQLLDFRDMCSLGRVSLATKELCDNDDLWRQWWLQNNQRDGKELQMLLLEPRVLACHRFYQVVRVGSWEEATFEYCLERVAFFTKSMVEVFLDGATSFSSERAMRILVEKYGDSERLYWVYLRLVERAGGVSVLATRCTIRFSFEEDSDSNETEHFLVTNVFGHMLFHYKRHGMLWDLLRTLLIRGYDEQEILDILQQSLSDQHEQSPYGVTQEMLDVFADLFVDQTLFRKWKIA